MIEKNIPKEVFEYYPQLSPYKTIESIEKGLINKTYKVITDTSCYILQEVSPIFDEGIHSDSKVIAEHLAQFGIMVPRIIPTQHNQLFLRVDDRVIRVLEYIDGESFNKISSLRMAFESGKVVGHFHYCLKDFSYTYASQRRHKGDYIFHGDNLNNALSNHIDHDYSARVRPLAATMLEAMRAYSSMATTLRHAHGDPKISNILFRHDQGLCLIDFDTLSYSGWSLEMGDALRSWCNPHLEDSQESYVDLPILESSLKGYASVMKGIWTAAEKQELIAHAEAVSLCLAIRYLTDVLNENYFSFAKTYNRAAEHNWLRALAMFNLYKDFVAKRALVYELVHDVL